MRAKQHLKLFVLTVLTLAWDSLSLRAQPVITNQPASQTNLAGTAVAFSVGVTGTGPFTYQWQCNGTNLPNNLITTVAGNGSVFTSADNFNATSTSMGPRNVAADKAGNFYVVDNSSSPSSSRIRKVNAYGLVTTVAGKNGMGYSGDGGAATDADLNAASGLGFDPRGNLYIADTSNNRIRKVDTNGIITTIAGNGSSAYAGDGGPATNASIWNPSGVVADASGQLFIADTSNNRIRKVDTNGIITTVAGNGSAAYSGDDGAATNASLFSPNGVALDATGNLYIADTYNNRIRMVDTNGIITTVAGNGNATYAGDGGPATSASINFPLGVALDSAENMYIADRNNNRIRRVDISGIITTIVGTGAANISGDGGPPANARIKGPGGVAVDFTGNLYIADSGNSRVRKALVYAGYSTLTLTQISALNAGSYYDVFITNTSGSVTSGIATLTVAAPPVITVQPASQTVAAGSNPAFAVAAAGSGTFTYLWHFDRTNLLQSGLNSTITLSGVSSNNSGNYTVAVTSDYGSVTSSVATLLVGYPPTITIQPASQTDYAGNNIVLAVTPGGIGPFTYQWQWNGTNLPNNIITTAAGNGTSAYSGDGGAATNASLYYPQGVQFDAAGNLHVADNINQRVRKVDVEGTITTAAGKEGAGGYSGDGGAATNANLFRPLNVTFDKVGNWYIADTYNHCIRKVDVNGTITTVAGKAGVSVDSGDGGLAYNATLVYPACVAFDPLGNWYIAEVGGNRIRKVDINGTITTVAGLGAGYYGYSGDGGAATNASINRPQGLAFDALGNYYIADTNNKRIRRVDTNGIITTVAGGGTNSPGDGGPATNALLGVLWSVAFDSAGNMYIADQSSSLVRKVDTNGIITTIAGNGRFAYQGDGIPATSTSLNGPACVALDAAGNLFIADWYNDRIREVHLAGFPALTFSSITPGIAGNYSVVVTSPYGSVTSSIVTLSVIPSTPPQIAATDGSFGFLNKQFGFNLSGAVGQTVVVDASTNLVNWQPLFTNTVASPDPFYFFDPNSTNSPWAFYRARLQ